ncbi:MAG: phasin family protein [Polaromonas sp.]
MVKKLKKMMDDKNNGPQLASAIKDSAQQIWLAGLGAFSKAQEEGSKVFDALVKEGQSIQRKTQSAAEDKITETASRMSDMASDLQSRAGNRWDKLETIFEERVAKALGKLGVPLAKEVQALAERVEQLNQRLEKMSASGAHGAHGSSQRGNGAASTPKAQPTRKTAARTTTPTTSRATAKKASQPTTASPATAAKRPSARKTVRSAAAKRAATQTASSEAGTTAADAAA